MTSTERRRASAPTIPRPGLASDAELERLRRRVYTAVCGVGVFTSTGIWALNLLRPTPDPITTVTNPLFALLAVWVMWWLGRGRPFEAVHWVSLTLCGAVIAARALLAPLAGADLLASLQDLYWLLVVVSIIAFLTVEYRRAIQITAGFYAAAALGPWAATLLGWATLTAPARLGQVQLLCAVVLITLWSLAWYREHFQRGREELQLTQRLASTDALTGLDNRHALYPLLDALLATPIGPDDVCGSVLLIDIDHFKRVNDTLGHAAGDDVLRHVAHTLRARLRNGDLLGRWGGEEFLVALPGLGPADAAAVADRLRRSVAAGTVPHAPDLAVTVSIGVSAAWRGDTLQSCVARADTALYRAKADGRDRVHVDTGLPDVLAAPVAALTPGA